MALQRPNVTLRALGPFHAHLHWFAVGTSLSTVYRLELRDKSLPPKHVARTADTQYVLNQLQPDTEYVVAVHTLLMDKRSPDTVVKFRTLPVNILASCGSGNVLYPSSIPPLSSGNVAALHVGPHGYHFREDTSSYHVFGKAYQFTCFDLGSVAPCAHMALKIVDPTGEWILTNGMLDDTILQVAFVDDEKKGPCTGWLDANSHAVKGVADLEHGGRVLDDSPSPHVRHLTFARALGGHLFVRIGLASTGGRTLSGILIFTG